MSVTSFKDLPGAQRVVIVGCGQIAGGYNELHEDVPLTHIAAYRQLGAHVVGCCDIIEKKARTFAHRWSVDVAGTDLSEVLRETQPEVVSICTPTGSRMALLNTIMATASVKSVLIEKPLATSFREAQEIHLEAKKWGRPVLVNYFRAYDPFYRSLANDCRQAKLGVLYEVTARYYGSMWANASHLLERLLDMMGEPTRLCRLSGDDTAPLFEIQFGELGKRALFLPTVGPEYSPLELDFLFQYGRIRVIDSEHRVERFVYRPNPIFDGFFELTQIRGKQSEWPNYHAILGVVEAVLEAACGKPADTSVFTRAVSVTKVLEAIQAS